LPVFIAWQMPAPRPFSLPCSLPEPGSFHRLQIAPEPRLSSSSCKCCPNLACLISCNCLPVRPVGAILVVESITLKNLPPGKQWSASAYGRMPLPFVIIST